MHILWRMLQHQPGAPVSSDSILQELGRMVAASQGWPAAKIFKSYRLTPQDHPAIARCAKDVTKIFPDDGPAHLLATALFLQLQRHTDAPVQMVSGQLEVAGERLGEYVEAANGGTARHLWIMAGSTIVDPGIFRIASGNACPPRARQHILGTLGVNKAIYVDGMRNARRLGFGYMPARVLDAGGIDALMQQAYQMMARA